MLILLVFLLLIFPKIAIATGEFNIIQNISYIVNQQGTANIRQEINLTNNFSQIYAKEYEVTLTGSNLKNISGTDSSGNIINRIETNPDQTNIFLKFTDPAIGKNQSKKFFLNYSISDFANKKGNTWEIQFPVFDISSEVQPINISLEIPSSFGDLSFSSIPVSNIHNLNDTIQINFNQTQISNKKILLVFGNHQLFDFQLHYYLENTQNYDINTEIPIPPDTNTQNIILSKLEPPPTSIQVDPDGNWLAQYFIAKNQSLNITVTGQARIHPPIVSDNLPINNDQYLSAQQYWPVNDSQIASLAQTLNSPKSIYQYTVNTLNYDYDHFDTASRKGALSAINFPNSSLCTEFTDLFVTLARSKNIPAREIEGFAYSNNSKIKPINLNSDVLHAWPEYFDPVKKQWIQVDPTWEKTTNGIDYFNDLDLNHLTFVIHGLQSSYPFPPGSYKKNPSDKSVFVDFATEELQPNFMSPQVDLVYHSLIIKNPNLFSLHTLHLIVNNTGFQTDISFLPPLGTSTIQLPSPSFLKSLLPPSNKYKISLTLRETNHSLSYELTNQQFYFYLTICIGIVIFLLCLGGIILTASHKSNEKNS